MVCCVGGHPVGRVGRPGACFLSLYTVNITLVSHGLSFLVRSLGRQTARVWRAQKSAMKDSVPFLHARLCTYCWVLCFSSQGCLVSTG